MADIDKIVLLLASDNHEDVCLGFYFMEALGLTQQAITKYSNLNNFKIIRDDVSLKASGQINEKITNLLAKLSLNSVSYYSNRVYKRVSKYAYSFLGMFTESEKKKYLKKDSVTYCLQIEEDYVNILINCIFKKCKEIEIRKSILEKIPNMASYKKDNVSCLLNSINDKEYSFEFTARIKIDGFVN